MSYTQMITFRAPDLSEVDDIRRRWVEASSDERTATHVTVYRDREHTDRYVQLVEFPSEQAAQQNSDLEATEAWSTEMRNAVDDMQFVNLQCVDDVDL